MNAEAPPNYVGRHGRREEAAAAARSAAGTAERPLPTAPAVPAPRVFTAPPPFAPGASAPTTPATVPGATWAAPVSGPAVRPASAPPYPPVSAPPAAPPRRSRAMTTVVTILVVLVVAQAAGLGLLGWDYLHVRKQLQAANVSASAKINDLETRTAALEAAAKAAMDPAAVAKDALPSVFQVDAGDVIGTSWAIAHPTTGGTYLVTNFHVVSGVYATGGRQVTVERQQQRYPAKIQNVDQRADLALLYVTDQVFPVLAISKTSVVGEPIVALGEPLGLEDTVTAGVISDVQRQVQGAPAGITYLQFDAAINPGNSGGPLVNAARQVIGVVSLKYQDAEGLALALPVSTVCDSFGIC